MLKNIVSNVDIDTNGDPSFHNIDCDLPKFSVYDF